MTTTHNEPTVDRPIDPHAARAAAADFPIGTVVRLKGHKGVFKVMGYGKDGSVTMYGGTAGHGGYRNVMPDRLTKVKVK